MRLFLGLITLVVSGPLLSQMVYPVSKSGREVSSFHETSVQDPYRWLELIKSDDVKGWMGEQSRLTENYLAGSEARSLIRKQLLHLNSAPTYGLPTIRSTRRVWRETVPGIEHVVLKSKRTDSQVEEIVVDPNKIAPDGSLSLSMYSVSPDGKMLVYTLRKRGAQRFSMFVKSLDGPEVFTEISNPPRFSGNDGIGWVNGSAGFYYAKEVPAGNDASDKETVPSVAIYYHAVGSSSTDDVYVIGGNANPDWRYTVNASDDGSYLYVRVWKKTGVTTAVLLIPLVKGVADPSKKVVIDEAFSAKHQPLGIYAGKLYMLTNESAPKWRVAEVDPAKPLKEFWKTVVPESDVVLDEALLTDGKIAATSLVDAASALAIYETNGKLLKRIELPSVGTLTNMAPNAANSNLIFGFQSINLPRTFYELNLKTFRLSVQMPSRMPFDSTKYEVTEVFVPARDGTRIPVFIGQKKGTKQDGSTPFLLSGYGGFNVVQGPYFSMREAAWLELGGGIAIAAVRGGGEYGEKWHKDGMLLRKRNSIYDYVDVAKWLVDNKYTRSKHLGSIGLSAGGLLVSAALNERPDLFGAVINGFGLTDMIRQEEYKAYYDWTEEFGTVKKEDQFRVLLSYSPLHNIKKGTPYPPVMVTAGELDDRVLPWHQYKYVAALQNSDLGDSPKLLHISYGTGHVFGKTQTTLLNERTDALTFFAKSFGMIIPN